MKRLLATTALAALALFSGVLPANARELITTNQRRVCTADGRRIPCRLALKCIVAGGDKLVHEGQRWHCCDAFVGDARQRREDRLEARDRLPGEDAMERPRGPEDRVALRHQSSVLSSSAR